MIPSSIVNFFAAYQDLLWLATVAIDLSVAIAMYRFFGKMGLYAVVVLNIMLTNLQGPKLVEIFGMQTSMGVILYAGIYFATDVISEKYGKREANRAVMIGFAVSVAVVLMMSVSLLFQPSQHPDIAEKAIYMHDAIGALFNYTPLMVFGSLFAYFVSQNLDVWIFHFIKEKTQGRHLWLRNNLSTITSQAVDTVLFNLIVMAPIFGLEIAMKLAVAKYIFKVVIAVLDTPFIYLARSWDMHHKDWHMAAGREEREHNAARASEKTAVQNETPPAVS